MFRILSLAAWTAATLLLFPGGSVALTIDEAFAGDLSNDRLAPSAFTLELGSNPLLATTISGDLEYVTLVIPSGLSLASISLVDYVGGDPIAFMAIQSGTTFTEPPVGTAIFRLLGWTHFGPSAGNVGTDILDDLGLAPGAIGFTPAVPSGPYTFWIQQTGSVPTDYHFDFVLTPEPSTGLLVAAGCAALGGRRRSPRAAR